MNSIKTADQDNITKTQAMPAAEISKLLEQLWESPQPEQTADLTYWLEKISRKLLKDRSKEQSVHQFNAAVENLRKHARIHQHPEQELQLLLSTGQTYVGWGLISESAACYEKAIELARRLKNGLLHARALRLLGNTKMHQNRINDAIRCFQKSIDLCQNEGESVEEACGLNSLSTAYFQRAAWRKMENACNQALAICDQFDEEELVPCIYNNLGAMYSLRGKLENALAAYQKCLPLFEKHGNERGLAEAYNNLATVYRDKDIWHEAGKCFAKSLRFANHTGNTIVKASAMLNRVDLYILMHDLELAKQQSLEAMSIFHNIGHVPGEADACKLLGVIYGKEENAILAHRYFNEALELSTQQNYALGLAETHHRYGEFYLDNDDKAKALEHLEQSLKRYRGMKATLRARKINKTLKSLKNAS